MSPECVCEVLAQNTRQIIFYSLLKLPLLGYEPNRADIECFALMQISWCSWRRGWSFKSSSSALAVLAFANKHSTISTSLLSLQKTTRFQSQSSACTVHNKFAFLNYTDREHGGIKITT